MKKILIFILILCLGFLIFNKYYKKDEEPMINQDIEEEKMKFIVKDNKNDFITITYNEKDYTFYNPDFYDVDVGDVIEVIKIVNPDDFDIYDTSSYRILGIDYLEKKITPGLFSNYYSLAYDTLKNMNLDEKIGQILLVSYPGYNASKYISEYHYGGYLFFAKDFNGKNKDGVINMINQVQSVSKIPLLIAVDEEGGGVVRVSSNPLLRSAKFKSPQNLFKEGGFDKISEDTKEKSTFLHSFGINVNLAPVVDVSLNSSDYMYYRSLGQDALNTGVFARTVIEASKDGNVSYALKHFPGYGNNKDTHKGISVDTRSKEKISEDLTPFLEGIDAGAEMVLVSHNIVKVIDDYYPASLSSKIHQLLRHELEFSGVIVTDDISMGALNNVGDKAVLALTSGNDLIITGDTVSTFNQIKKAINNGEIEESFLDSHVLRVLAFKYYKNLL